jgi:hypothetical protein
MLMETWAGATGAQLNQAAASAAKAKDFVKDIISPSS